MPPSGKSQPPPPPRDARVDSGAPVPLTDDVRRISSKPMRAARDLRSLGEEAERQADVARLRAERASDVDDIAAMLVRVAETERAREAYEKRTNGLEAWTQSLEGKVAEARTRADELEIAAAGLRKELLAARREAEELKARNVALEADLAVTKREAEDALELERVQRGLEIDALVAQHNTALSLARAERTSAAPAAAVAKVMEAIEELDRLEADARVARSRVLEDARRSLTTEHVTAPPPDPRARITRSIAKQSTARTVPPAEKPPSRKKGRRPSAPPLHTPFQPVTKPSVELETFEDLLDLND